MLYVLIPLIILLMCGIIYFSRQIVYPKIYTHEETEQYELENDTFFKETFHAYRTEHITISSTFGYTLKGELVLQKEVDKVVLLCHGITSNYTGVKKYCKLFLDAGFSIMLYDHRNHGLSDKNNTSFGYFEKFDAKTCIDYVYNKFDNPVVGVMGESMGASTAMQLASIDHRLAFCIEDCGYSNAFKLFKYRSQEDNHKLVSYLTYPTNYYLKLLYKWDFNDISVVKYINNIQCPILFIHGEEDDYVPFSMVHELYNAFNGEKMLYTVPDAGHAQSIRVNPNEYQKTVHEFLHKHIKKRT